jgi:hypothetical protein
MRVALIGAGIIAETCLKSFDVLEGATVLVGTAVWNQTDTPLTPTPIHSGQIAHLCATQSEVASLNDVTGEVVLFAFVCIQPAPLLSLPIPHALNSFSSKAWRGSTVPKGYGLSSSLRMLQRAQHGTTS